MDFRQSAQPAGRPVATPVPVEPQEPPKRHISPRGSDDNMKIFRILNAVILICVAILIAAVGIFFMSGRTNHESKYVDTTKYQAVFLNNGQVYFGKVNNLNQDYFAISDIYYLTQATSTDASGKTTSDSSYTLVKLGCQQIHDPTDQMVINRTQITFWENLNSGGQVAKKIAEFKKSYPNGPDCSQVSSQTQAATTNTQGATTTTK